MMRLRHGDFEYLVRPNGGPKKWAWEIYHPIGAVGPPIRQGDFNGSEGRAHIAARDAIARLREERAATTVLRCETAAGLNRPGPDCSSS